MADQQPAQTAASHAHRPTLTFVAALFAILALAFFIVDMLRHGITPLALGALALTAAVLALVWISRSYIVRLQDRIIRLEMRLRMERLGLGAEFRRLSTRQIVALRFASDGELEALTHRAIAENMTSRQIKEAVRDWQPDYHRT